MVNLTNKIASVQNYLKMNPCLNFFIHNNFKINELEENAQFMLSNFILFFEENNLASHIYLPRKKRM